MLTCRCKTISLVSDKTSKRYACYLYLHPTFLPACLYECHLYYTIPSTTSSSYMSAIYTILYYTFDHVIIIIMYECHLYYTILYLRPHHHHHVGVPFIQYYTIPSTTSSSSCRSVGFSSHDTQVHGEREGWVREAVGRCFAGIT